MPELCNANRNKPQGPLQPIDAAAARGDAAALAYELGRLDATEAEELATGIVESALERLRLLPVAGEEAEQDES